MHARSTRLVTLLVGWAFGVGCSAQANGGGVIVITDAGGSDVATSTNDGGPTPMCTVPQVACGGACVNLQTSAANCGACDNPCGSGQRCVGAICTSSSTCAALQQMCGGTCTDVTSDPANCGACGRSCASGQTCTASACVAAMTCIAPMTLCGSDCTNLTTDSTNCGACGHACAAGQHCASGACVSATTTCTAPEIMCASGCTNVTSDPNNCSRCGQACAVGQSCVAGTCSTPTTGTTYAGAPCTTSADCGTLMCATNITGGACTSSCTETGTSSEASECGGGNATCLSIGDTMPTSYCLAACTPGMTGACRAGFVCTGWWYTHAMSTPDSPGCFPFCRSDADCAASGPTCNTRTGSCGTAAAVLSRLPDGSPCDPTMTTPDSTGTLVNTQCRGICFHVGTPATEGICGSLINIENGLTCPDNPTAILPQGISGSDDLGLCIVATCTSSTTCPSGLTCVLPTGSTTRVCTYIS